MESVTAVDLEVINMPIEFDDIAPIEVPVKRKGLNYVLCECDEGGAVKYRAASMRGVRLVETEDGQEVVMGDGQAESEPLLVSLCLHQVYPDGRRRQVSLSEIKTWRPEEVKQLHERAKAISNLGEDSDDPDKLRKQIARLQKRLERLENGSAAKNGQGSPNGTTHT